MFEEKIASLCTTDRAPSVFICEPLVGNAGGVQIPPGYLQRVYAAVRCTGGLCIADEVQVGYGRLGDHFWGFQQHGVVPDILTMAKAAGNGHPFGYVVTSRKIAEEFRTLEGSFFSSAGGNPVSCVAAISVLDLLEKENLQKRAYEVGSRLKLKLHELSRKLPHVVGCIHGCGLYQGVELVFGSADLPAPSGMTKAVCDRMLEKGIICHGTGDYSNVRD